MKFAGSLCFIATSCQFVHSLRHLLKNARKWCRFFFVQHGRGFSRRAVIFFKFFSLFSKIKKKPIFVCGEAFGDTHLVVVVVVVIVVDVVIVVVVVFVVVVVCD